MTHQPTLRYYQLKKQKPYIFLKFSNFQLFWSYIMFSTNDNAKYSKTDFFHVLLFLQYAVKQTIIHQRQERSSGDPWDEFFYRIYSADKPRIDNARQCHSAGIKLNLNKDLQDKLNFTDYDSSIKDKLTPYKSSSSDRGKRAFENLSRVSSSISKRRQHEISDKDGREEAMSLWLNNSFFPSYLQNAGKKYAPMTKSDDSE
nr:RecName: Full=Uncharacterized protein F15G9.3 [Caenorhabditis elegans]